MSKKVVCSTVLLLMVGTVGSASAELVGYWRFDEGSGTRAADSTGNGGDGTFRGSPQWMPGRIGSALAFDGDDWVDCGDILDIAGAITIACWVNPAELTDDNGWVARWDVYAFKSSGRFLRFTTPGILDYTARNTTLQIGEWQHVAVTFVPNQRGGAIFYFDGVEAQRIDSTGMTAGGTQFGIGNDRWGEFYEGLIDDVRVYDTILTEVEIQAVMQGFFPFATGPNPAKGALHEGTWVSFSWQPGDFAVSHDMYLGDNFDDVNNGAADTFRGNQGATDFIAGLVGSAYPDGLVPGTTYYWRIDEVNNANPNSPWKGDIWSFFVPPRTAYAPVPSDGAESVSVAVELAWTAGLGATSHAVYFDDSFDYVNSATEGIPLEDTTFTPPGPLEFAKTYYWRVDTFDGVEWVRGEVWNFSSRAGVSYIATDGSDANPGTRELPWRTVAYAGQMVYPGDTVIVMDGVYLVEGQLQFGPSGLSADRMTTYKAAPGARVIFSGRDDIPPVVGMPDYVRLEGLWFGGTWMPEGTKNSSIQVGGSPIGRGKQMVNCTIFGYNDGILIGTTEHLLVYGNRLIHTGAGGYQHGIYLSGGSSTSYCSNHVIVDNNIFLDGEGYAIHGWHGPRSMIVTRNFISGHHHGIVMAGSDHLIANNFVWSSKAENPYSILFSGRNIVAVNNMLRQGSPAAAFNSNRLESNAFLETYSAGLSPIILSSGNEQSEFGISAKEIDDIVAELSNIFYQPVETIHADQRIEPLFAKLRMTIPNGSQLKDAGQAWYEPGKSVNIGPDADQPACVGTLWYAFREWGLQDWDRERTVYEPDLSGVSEGRAPDIRDNDLDGSSNDSDPDDDNDGIPDAQDSDRDGDMVDDSDEIILAKDPDSQLSTPRGEPVLEVSHEVIALDSIFGLNPPGMTLRLRNRGVGGLAWGAAAENSWVELSSTSGLLNTAEKKYLELIFATEALPAGKHTTNIVFTYEQNTLILPVLVTVYRQSRLGQELLHHFTFDEGQGSTARDRIRGRNGIVHGGSWVQGQIGSALHFDGVDDYVEIPDSITDFSQFTVVLWFKTRSRGQAGYGAAGFSDNTMWQCYLAAAGDAAEISLATINGRLRATFNLWQNGDARNLYSGVEANDDQWHQAALTISAEEQICLYLDGILVASRAIREDASVINQKTPGEQQIAYTRWWRDPPKYYSGAIDDVRFYGRALSPAEIDVLFLMATAPDDWGLPGSGSSSGEDFESGDMSGSDWTTYGDSDWYITSSESYSGTYSIRAGSIGDNESSTLAIEHECSAGDITFYLKVSSESGWDKLVFYIDRVKQHEWSGERSWDQVSFPVESGTRTFEWVYTKDESSDDGSDTAWLDDISFP